MSQRAQPSIHPWRSFAPPGSPTKTLGFIASFHRQKHDTAVKPETDLSMEETLTPRIPTTTSKCGGSNEKTRYGSSVAAVEFLLVSSPLNFIEPTKAKNRILQLVYSFIITLHAVPFYPTFKENCFSFIRKTEKGE